MRLGSCGTCETFYLMARLCVEECGAYLQSSERAEAMSWLDAGTVIDLGFGCDGACGIIQLYSKVAGP